MIDYCLRFDLQQDAQTFLFDGETPLFAAVDFIGEIEGSTGFHVNVRHTEEVPAFAPFIVQPVTPARVWF